MNVHILITTTSTDDIRDGAFNILGVYEKKSIADKKRKKLRKILTEYDNAWKDYIKSDYSDKNLKIVHAKRDKIKNEHPELWEDTIEEVISNIFVRTEPVRRTIDDRCEV